MHIHEERHGQPQFVAVNLLQAKVRRSRRRVLNLEQAITGIDEDVERLEEQKQLLIQTVEDLKERKEALKGDYRWSKKLYEEAKEDYEAVCLIHSGLEPVSEFEDVVSSDNEEGSAAPVPVLKKIPPSSLRQFDNAEEDTSQLPQPRRRRRAARRAVAAEAPRNEGDSSMSDDDVPHLAAIEDSAQEVVVLSDSSPPHLGIDLE